MLYPKKNAQPCDYLACKIEAQVTHQAGWGSKDHKILFVQYFGDSFSFLILGDKGHSMSSKMVSYN